MIWQYTLALDEERERQGFSPKTAPGLHPYPRATSFLYTAPRAPSI